MKLLCDGKYIFFKSIGNYIALTVSVSQTIITVPHLTPLKILLFVIYFINKTVFKKQYGGCNKQKYF